MRLHVGGGTGRGALTVFPVWGEYDGPRGYSLDPSGIELAERVDGPAVPVLAATSRATRPTLLLEGQVLEGGWQDRALLRSVLVPAGGTMDLEVACVEAGRWHGAGAHASRGRMTSPRVRSALRGERGRPDRTRGDRQGEVWRRVSEYDALLGANDTASFATHAERAAAEVRRLVGELRPLPGQVGIVVGIEGQPVMLEVFDSPTTLRRRFADLVTAAGLDALGRAPVETPSRRARRLADHVARVRLVPSAPAGVGTTVLGSDEYAGVAALAWRRRLVHLSATNPRHPLHQEVGA